MAATPSDSLRVRVEPVQTLFSRAPWTASLYLLTYPIVGTIGFLLAVVATLVAIPLAVTWLVLPILAFNAWVIRRCAAVERQRYRIVGPPLQCDHLPTSAGLLAGVRARWTEAATWRDLGYLVGLFVPLLALDVAALLVWLILLALLTCPLWFWVVPQHLDDGRVVHGLALGYLPDGPGAAGGWGVWIGSAWTAVLAALVAFVILLAYQYVLVGAAKLHRHAARVMLGPRIDPLAELREIVKHHRSR